MGCGFVVAYRYCICRIVDPDADCFKRAGKAYILVEKQRKVATSKPWTVPCQVQPRFEYSQRRSLIPRCCGNQAGYGIRLFGVQNPLYTTYPAIIQHPLIEKLLISGVAVFGGNYGKQTGLISHTDFGPCRTAQHVLAVERYHHVEYEVGMSFAENDPEIVDALSRLSSLRLLDKLLNSLIRRLLSGVHVDTHHGIIFPFNPFNAVNKVVASH